MRRTAVAGFFRVAGFGFMALAAVVFFVGQPAEGESQTGVNIAAMVFGMIGFIWWVVGVGVNSAYERSAKRLAADRQLFETGEVATAVIEHVEPTATSINEMPLVKVTVRIQPTRGEAFSHTEKIVTPAMAIPLPGHVVRVAYDPADPSDVAFETQPGFDGPPGVILVTRPQGPGDNHQATPPPAGDDGEPDERLDRLERLAKLHEAGVLTDAEFADQKARILDER